LTLSDPCAPQSCLSLCLPAQGSPAIGKKRGRSASTALPEEGDADMAYTTSLQGAALAAPSSRGGGSRRPSQSPLSPPPAPASVRKSARLLASSAAALPAAAAPEPLPHARAASARPAPTGHRQKANAALAAYAARAANRDARVGIKFSARGLGAVASAARGGTALATCRIALVHRGVHSPARARTWSRCRRERSEGRHRTRSSSDTSTGSTQSTTITVRHPLPLLGP
jgi:hypothetical protein